jgi:uncharacterized glyoxalase superfamily protein PhnB
LKNKSKESLNNEAIFLPIEVGNVDELYKKAKKQKIEITYEITDEDWGVRRFFVKEPNGATLNFLSHKNNESVQ